MSHLKSFSSNLIGQLDHWLEDHLPAGVHKQITLRPDRPLKPDNYKAAIAFNLLIIGAAILLLILTLK